MCSMPGVSWTTDTQKKKARMGFLFLFAQCRFLPTHAMPVTDRTAVTA